MARDVELIEEQPASRLLLTPGHVASEGLSAGHCPRAPLTSEAERIAAFFFCFHHITVEALGSLSLPREIPNPFRVSVDCVPQTLYNL